MEQISNRQDFKGLYSPQFEHDNCGIGAVVNINGIKTHDTVANALTIVETLEHRAGKDAEGKTGDGVGIAFIEILIYYHHYPVTILMLSAFYKLNFGLISNYV